MIPQNAANICLAEIMPPQFMNRYAAAVRCTLMLEGVPFEVARAMTSEPAADLMTWLELPTVCI